MQRIGSITSMILFVCWLLFAGPFLAAIDPAQGVIDIIADRDNRFKVPKQKEPTITVRAREVVILRIVARRALEWDKDGAVHSFTIPALKDQGWDLRLKEGTQQFPVVAPAQPGEYVVECSVKCGKGHDDMKLKLVVTP